MIEKINKEKYLKTIRAVVFDFDGVFTDNRVFVSEDGSESVACNRSDGLGISRLRTIGIEMLILSTETNPVVSQRAEKLKLPVIQSVEDKLSVLIAWSEKNNIPVDQIAYVGNDINDKDCLQTAGLSAVVADAFDEIRPFAKIILNKKGGQGAVREFCDLVWKAHQKGE